MCKGIKVTLILVGKYMSKNNLDDEIPSYTCLMQMCQVIDGWVIVLWGEMLCIVDIPYL